MGKKKKSSAPPQRFFGFDDDEDKLRAARPGAFKFGSVQAGRGGAGFVGNLQGVGAQERQKALLATGRGTRDGGGGGNPR